MLYFSYGSNMSHARILERVPSVKFFATAKLIEHELRFHKKSVDGSSKCDAYQTGNPDHVIIGVVFEIDEAEKPALDKKEGLGIGYEEKEVALITSTGEAIEALTYYATSIDEELKPYQWYKHHVLIGAQEYELPEGYRDRIKSIEAIEDQDRERHEREMGIYANK